MKNVPKPFGPQLIDSSRTILPQHHPPLVLRQVNVELFDDCLAWLAQQENAQLRRYAVRRFRALRVRHSTVSLRVPVRRAFGARTPRRVGVRVSRRVTTSSSGDDSAGGDGEPAPGDAGHVEFARCASTDWRLANAA